mgnify:CR=1 FL=1
MKKFILVLAGLGIALGAVAANAAPEDERLKVVDYFKNKYSDVKIDDYIYGALAFDPDSKAQYNSIMEFPPYVGEIEKGELRSFLVVAMDRLTEQVVALCKQNHVREVLTHEVGQQEAIV